MRLRFRSYVASGAERIVGTRRLLVSARGAGDERGDDVGGVPIQGLAATVKAHRRGGSAWLAATCTSRNGTPASKAAVMKA